MVQRKSKQREKDGLRKIKKSINKTNNKTKKQK